MAYCSGHGARAGMGRLTVLGFLYCPECVANVRGGRIRAGGLAKASQ